MDLSKIFMYNIAPNKGTDAWKLEVRSIIDANVRKIAPINAITMINLIDIIADFKEKYPQIYHDPNCRLLVGDNRETIDIFIFEFVRFVLTIKPNRSTLTSVEWSTSPDIGKRDDVPVINDNRLNTLIQDELRAMLYALACNTSIAIAKTIME